MERPRGWLGSLALVLATLGLCAGLGEVVLRLTSATRPAGERQRLNVYQQSAALSHALRPDWQVRFAFNDFDTQVRTNALGFRGPEVSIEKPAGAVRILVLGDSYTFGWGVEEEEMYTRVLEGRLREAGVPAEVISAGVPGYATDQHWIFLRERGFTLDPALVLLATCGNDTLELSWKDFVLDERRLPVASVSRRRFINRRGEMRFLNGALLELPGPPIPESLRGWLVEHSWAYGWLRIRLARAWVSAMERVAAPEEIPDDALPEGPVAELAPEEIDRLLRGSATFRLRYHRYIREAIEAATAERGLELRMLLAEGDGGLREDCAQLRCLDQAALFTREADPWAYLPVDGHWSARGHARIGDALAEWLLDDPELGWRTL